MTTVKQKGNKITILSLVGIILIGGFITFEAIKGKRQNDESISKVEARIRNQEQVNEQYKKQETRLANQSGTEEGKARSIIERYAYEAEQVDWEKGKVEMGYEYMTPSLAEDVKKKNGDQVERGVLEIIKFKRKLSIKEFRIDQIQSNNSQFDSEKRYNVKFTLTSILSENGTDKLKFNNQYVCELAMTGTESWLFTKIETTTLSKEIIKKQ